MYQLNSIVQKAFSRGLFLVEQDRVEINESASTREREEASKYCTSEERFSPRRVCNSLLDQIGISSIDLRPSHRLAS